jgi:hypothetical protein
MITRTDEEIQNEIVALVDLKRRLKVPTSVFGESHEASIAASINVLQRKLSLDDVDDTYIDFPSGIYDGARNAADWLTGSQEKAVSAEWLENPHLF